MKLSTAFAFCMLVMFGMAAAGIYPRSTDVYVVNVIDFAFEPAQLSIVQGDTVVWSVLSGTHSATSDTGVWDSGLLEGPLRFQRSFADAGQFPYYCVPHDFMRGAITVERADRAPVVVFWALAALSAGLAVGGISVRRKARQSDS